MTPKQWYDLTIGKAYNTDGYYGAQCWDYFDYFCRYMKITASRHCNLTGFAGDIWQNRTKNGFNKWFTFVTPDKIQEGDWLFWKKHVAFYYGGKEVGQNQGNPPRMYVSNMNLNRNGLLGGFRYKSWTKTTTKPQQTTTTPKTETKVGVADKQSSTLKGVYKVTAKAGLNIRTGGGTNYLSLAVLPLNTQVYCYGGFYTLVGKVKWLYVQANVKNRSYVGFVSSDYLKKVRGL